MNTKRLAGALAFAVLGAVSIGYATATERERDSNHRHPQFVGMWITNFYIGKFYGPGTALFDRAIQQFSSDGNELMNSGLFPPVVSAVCFGAWKASGPKTIKVRHIGWSYTLNNVFEGTFRMNSILTLGPDGDTFSGTYTADAVDANGSVLPGSPVEGDIRSTRFEVEEGSAADARSTLEMPSSGRPARRSGC